MTMMRIDGTPILDRRVAVVSPVLCVESSRSVNAIIVRKRLGPWQLNVVVLDRSGETSASKASGFRRCVVQRHPASSDALGSIHTAWQSCSEDTPALMPRPAPWVAAVQDGLVAVARDIGADTPRAGCRGIHRNNETLIALRQNVHRPAPHELSSR